MSALGTRDRHRLRARGRGIIGQVARQKPLLEFRALLEDAVFALRQRDELLLLILVKHRVEHFTGKAHELPTKLLLLGLTASHGNTAFQVSPRLLYRQIG